MKTIIEKVLHLQNVPLFKDVPTEQLSYLASISNLTQMPADATLFEDGDDSSTLYIIVEGKVNIMKKQALVRQLSTFEVVGIFGFFDQQPRIFSAQCETDCQFLEISSDRFFELMDERLDIARHLMKYFVLQLRRFVSEVDLPEISKQDQN